MSQFPYPMWCIVCKDCGFVGTRWENPGTSASYVKYCPYCGISNVTTKKVENKAEHKEIAEDNYTYDEL